MTPKQNVLEVLKWGKPEYIPMTFECFNIVGFGGCTVLEEPMEPGYDPFGVYWHVTPEGSIPDSRTIILEDIADWREKVKIPDPEQHRELIMQIAAAETANIDRENKLTDMYYCCGLFERMAALMTFGNALMALAEDPDECRALMEAITEYKLKSLDILIEAYKPDIVTYYDDVATASSLFMSPQVYREVIKPYHAKIAKFVLDKGLMFKQHTCGKCESLLEDFVEIGACAWHSAQIMNDLPAIQEKFRGRLVIEGGWDSSGPCSYINASVEDMQEEVRRNIRDYGSKGGFILLPMVMNEKGNALVVGDARMPALIEEWAKHCKV